MYLLFVLRDDRKFCIFLPNNFVYYRNIRFEHFSFVFSKDDTRGNPDSFWIPKSLAVEIFDTPVQTFDVLQLPYYIDFRCANMQQLHILNFIFIVY